jgi:hypothetical protein
MRLRFFPFVLLGACQLPTTFSPPSNTKEVTQLKQENQSLKDQLEKLNSELKALRAAPALLSQSHANPVLVTLPGASPSSYPTSGPASNPSQVEERTLVGRAAQNKLVSEYGEEYTADVYRKMLSEAPDDPAALYLAARFSPDPDDQLAYCQKALEFLPRFGFAHHCVSVAYRKKGDGPKALAQAEEAQKYSASVEISANAKELKQKEMKWFTQSLAWLSADASTTREFSLGLAKTSATLRGFSKGLACSASLRTSLPWRDCAGVVCGEVVFAYDFNGPEDPYYSHTQVCGEQLIFSDQAGETLASETKLACSRLDTGKTISAQVSVCLSSQDEQINKVHIDVPGIQSPLFFTK